jgi:hypothetical protein
VDKRDLETCLEAIALAVDEFPFKSFPVDVEGTKYEIAYVSHYEVPPDLAGLIEAMGAADKVRQIAESRACKFERTADGAFKISNPSRPAGS